MAIGDPFASGAGDTFEIDMTGVKTFESVRVPAGWYKAEVVDLTKGVSSKGNPQWSWRFMISDGPEEGKVIFLNTFLTPQALWRTAEVVRALGFGSGGSVASFSKEDAIGRRCSILAADDDYDGDVRSIIKRVKAHPEGPGA